MSVKLTYTTVDGEVEEVEYDTNVEIIDLSRRRIDRIDLAPLSSCTNLQVLNLRFHRLDTIDLSPIRSCNHLRELVLGGDKRIQNFDSSILDSWPNLQHLDLEIVALYDIDLSQIASCTNLRTLNLGNTFLREINLMPLRGSKNLQSLSLWGNKIQGIDLSPLETCTNLQAFDLRYNQLQSVDIDPLSSCLSLESLNLGGNQLHNIDLSPLENCTELRGLSLWKNQFRFVDMTPLFNHGPIIGCRSAEDDFEIISWLRPSGPLKGDDPFEYSSEDVIPHSALCEYLSPAQLSPWSFLCKIATQFPNNYRIQQDILKALGLGDYGFIDCDLTDQFLAIPPVTYAEDVREILTKRLVEEIVITVDRDGPTTGLNLEKLVSKHGEIAIRAQEILKLREQEIEQTTPTVNGDEVDLKPLWVIAYGYEILSALDFRLTTNSQGLERVKQSFEDIGHELHIGDSLTYGVNMSDDLKNCIWWIAENKGKLWNEIESN